MSTLRIRQKIGKYRILGRIASGPLADVYKAFDTIHKTRVALKIPKAGDEEEFLRSHHEVGFYLGLELAVHVGHLQLVFEVGHGA